MKDLLQHLNHNYKSNFLLNALFLIKRTFNKIQLNIERCTRSIGSLLLVGMELLPTFTAHKSSGLSLVSSVFTKGVDKVLVSGVSVSRKGDSLGYWHHNWWICHVMLVICCHPGCDTSVVIPILQGVSGAPKTQHHKEGQKDVQDANHYTPGLHQFLRSGICLRLPSLCTY